MGKHTSVDGATLFKGGVPPKHLPWHVLLVILTLPGLTFKIALSQSSTGIAPASQMDLPRLVDLCSQRLGLRIDYDPAVVKGQIVLRLPDSLNNDELWTLTNHALAQRGLATIRATHAESITVVRATDAAQAARIEHVSELGVAQAAGQPGFTSLVMAPKYRSAKDMAEAIKPMLTKGVGSATPLGASRLLLVSDYTGRLVEIQNLIDRLDAPTDDMVTEEIDLSHAAPHSVVAMVMQIINKRDAVAGDRFPGEILVSPNGTGVIVVTPRIHANEWRGLVARFDRTEGLEVRNYVPRVFAVRDVARLVDDSLRLVGSRDQRGASEHAIRVVVDDLTGTLVITATPSQHAQIATIMDRLDSSDGLAYPMRSYPIRNRPAQDMQSTLSGLISAGALDVAGDSPVRDAVRNGSEQRTLRDIQSPNLISAPPPTGDGDITPDTGTGSHRARGSSPAPHSNARLRLAVDEATNTLIAIGEPRLLSQLDNLITMLDVRQPQVMLEAVFVSITDSEALNLGIELERLGNLNGAAYKVASLFGLSTSANGTRAVADSAGFTGLILDPGEFTVVVKALQAINDGRSLSNPKVLVANNEQARFSSVLQQPFVRTDTTSNTATSSFGGSDSAGTTISVRPQIAQGDHLVLTYSINISSFVGTPAAAGLPPPKQQNSVDSVATIPDGYAVVVGGLELESQSTSTSQVPLLGDIPVLGELFKNRSIGRTRNRFFVFIRASVLRNSSFEDLKYISAKAASDAGVPDEWPTLEPRVIPSIAPMP